MMMPAIPAITRSEKKNISAPLDEPDCVDEKASGWTSNISVSPISEYIPWMDENFSD